MCTPQSVNFMAKNGRGLICLALTQERATELNIPMMTQANGTPNQTAFTVSIEAKEGISTGISAHDRAHTISVAIDATKGSADIVSPGHVFPLVARHGGTLVRAGHTEAAVDIARLAGLNPAGVICEIMNDDGTMARMPDLVPFAQLHGLKIGTIADLIAYRRKYDHFVKRTVEAPFESHNGGAWNMCIYVNTLEYAEHIALVKGDISTPEPVMVRMHAVNIFSDMLEWKPYERDVLGESMRIIAKEGRGVVVLLRTTRPTFVSDVVTRRVVDDIDRRRVKEYGVGAQILLDLGIKDMILLTDTPEKKIVALEGYDLNIVGTHAIRGKAKGGGS
jgi:3,4-dihydroxy 2-butanone 4-phosphate synthase/GTP cyclohydrolase II